MPVPLAPYPTPTVPVTPPAANGKLLNSVLVLVCKESRILFTATYKKKKKRILFTAEWQIGYRDHTVNYSNLVNSPLLGDHTGIRLKFRFPFSFLLRNPNRVYHSTTIMNRSNRRQKL